MFLEMLLLNIRGNTIKYSSKLKKQSNQKENKLIKEIEYLESLSNNSDANLICSKKDELQKLREVKSRGFMIRSRVQDIQMNEKPTKFFCNLEKVKYVDKTIKKIILPNGKLVQSQKEILAQIRQYYANLFSYKDEKCIDEENLENLFTTKRKLTMLESEALNGPITITELGSIVKSMKNNKTPGIDGFPADFFKVFWKDFKTYILRALNESYVSGILPPSLRQTVICCLPKGNKPRDNMKNWRPISLTSVLYKMATNVIASRLKKVLPDLISQSQTGFIKGRFIGESTRLVYDVMNYTEVKKIKGLLMFIDFEKAFDSVSWKFMYKVLRHFNFSEEFVNWITLFNNKITASVLQVGVLSEFFPIERGCKQGDPISPYLFLLCAQVLYEMIQGNTMVKGIKIGQEEIKISQFADDTTIFMDGSESSLQQILNILEVFGSLSGLKMNMSKTKMVWIGQRKYSKEKLCCASALNWGTNFFTLLGIDFDVNLQNIPAHNYSKALTRVEEIISAWKKRALTPLGKITVIKSLILSQLNHLFMAIPLPNNNFCADLNKKLYKFLWDGKPEKIKCTTICQNKIDGGLKMPDVEKFIKSLKCTWIRRLITSPTSPWAKLFERSYGPIESLFKVGPFWGIKSNKRVPNDFWKEIFVSWNIIDQSVQTRTEQSVLSTCLWYNSKIGNPNIFWKTWSDKGISVIGDIVHQNLKMMSSKEIEVKFGFHIRNFLEYFQVSSMVQRYINDNKHLFIQVYQLERPFIPQHISLFFQCKQGCRNIYNKVKTKEVECGYRAKWNKDLGIQIDNTTWRRVFYLIFNVEQDNNLIWFQYKLIHRILGTNSQMYKMSIEKSDKCRVCQSDSETFIHLFVKCRYVVDLWKDLEIWIHSTLGKLINFSPLDIILGYLHRDNQYIPINILIATTKYYIFKSALNKSVPNISGLKNKLKKKYEEQFYINSECDFGEKLYTSWGIFNNLFELA